MWTLSSERSGVEGIVMPRLRDVGAWFGMFLIDWSRPVMLVEGEIDAMRLMALGYTNVIASATSSVTDAQIDALAAETLVLGYDADAAGKHAHARIRDRVGQKAQVLEVDWSLAKKDGSPCKDAGDLPDETALREVLRGMWKKREKS